MIIANMAAKSSNMKKIRLVDVIRKKYPGLSGRQAFSILQNMRIEDEKQWNTDGNEFQ